MWVGRYVPRGKDATYRLKSIAVCGRVANQTGVQSARGGDRVESPKRMIPGDFSIPRHVRLRGHPGNAGSSATTGHENARPMTGCHSITSSASATKFGGSSMPVAFAVFRLITKR